MTATRVLVADDHVVVRAGLRSLLEEYDDLTVVGEASSGEEVLACVRSQRPDVVLLDITMPDTVATECIERIRELSPNTRVLVLTMHDDPLYVRSVLDAGASGYVTKSTAPDTLVRGIRTVREGGRFVAASSVSWQENGTAIPEQPVAVSRRALSQGPPVVELSRRERQVLALLARGHTYQEIADQLSVSTNSVGTYRSRIAVKLGVESRADLVRRAFESGLLDPN